MDGKDLGSAILILTLLIAVTLSAQALYADDGSQTGDEGDDPEPEAIKYLEGYVYDIPELEERKVIAGVTVTTYMSNDREYESTLTDSYGRFKVSYNSDVKYISFWMSGYTIKGWCSELTRTGDTGLYSINLKDHSETEGVHHLYDDSGYTVLISRTNESVFGNVSTIFNKESMDVPNATVSLSQSGTSVSAVTDSLGNFSIVCASGQYYTLTVVANGFKTLTVNDVTPGNTPYYFVLEQKDHTVFLDLDLSHTLALIGLLITLIVAIVAVYLVKRPERQGRLFVVNDIPAVKKKKE
jgi:hypothetical protein